MTPYESLQKKLSSGWNTFNTRSVLSHVLLPQGLCINIGIHERFSGQHLWEAQIARPDQREEQVAPRLHAFDGSYSELEITWKNVNVLIQSAVHNGDIVILATPQSDGCAMAHLVADISILWNRPGTVCRCHDCVEAALPDKTICIYGTHAEKKQLFLATRSPFIAFALAHPVGISAGAKRTVDEIAAIIDAQRKKCESSYAPHADCSDIYDCIHTCLAWDTIYDDEKKKVISPVSRIWNCNWGGWVLFDWDTYFAAYMAMALDYKELAYANAIEITREVEHCGFVPNYGSADGKRTYDRSQPPVGSLVVHEIYRRFGEKWFLEEVFENLLTWNRWFDKNRNVDGYLCWGSNMYKPDGRSFPGGGVNKRFGAALESGLDNSPMYDDMPFDGEKSCMLLADVGLMSMYIMDCNYLGAIARELGKNAEAGELADRAARYGEKLKSLWSEEHGLFCNKRLDTSTFEYRLSPTHFYPLMANIPSQQQAERMIQEHFYNEKEFWGEWIIPSIAKSDPAYPEQKYWRGRIWAPMNFLVYIGMCNYDLKDARRDLADKSMNLLMKEWKEKRHVHENYNGNTGEGCDSTSSDAFYHWGGLLGIVGLLEKGYIDSPSL
jgi:hypothetical protein